MGFSYISNSSIIDKDCYYLYLFQTSKYYVHLFHITQQAAAEVHSDLELKTSRRLSKRVPDLNKYFYWHE